MALEDVLAGLPVRGEYLAQQAFDQKQAIGLASMLRQAQQLKLEQAQEQRIRELQPLQMEMLRAQIARQQQDTQMRADLDTRQKNAMLDLEGFLKSKYPGTRAEMDAADNVMTPEKQAPEVSLFRAAAALDPRDATNMALTLAGMKGGASGGRGVDPMMQRNINYRDQLIAKATQLEQQGDTAGAAKARADAEQVQRVIDFESTKADRFGRTEDRRDLDLYDRTGQMPRQQAQPQPRPQAAPQAPQQAPQQSGELQFPSSGRATDPAQVALQREAGTYGDMSRESALRGAMGAPAGAPAPEGPQLAPKDQRATSVAGIKAANEDFVKKEFRASQESAGAARQMNNQVDAFRALPISKKTGWSTDAQHYAAKVLAAIPGMEKSDIAKFAASAEQFNSIMFRQNWSLLMDQKGVQTEGDAVRAQKVFAQLGNRPESNEFIWDFSKAVNDAAIRKAKFYSDNYPQAVRSGNVYELESQWAERNKDYSIWNEPSMKKWQNASAPSGPQPGFTKGGYRFKGGDPAKQENWERM